ncbi:MAG: hypothetical protein V4641_01785 [Pseudomonadota bacterium]
MAITFVVAFFSVDDVVIAFPFLLTRCRAISFLLASKSETLKADSAASPRAQLAHERPLYALTAAA